MPTPRIEVTPDDRIWYVDHAAGFLGAYNQATKQYKEWPMPNGAQSRPYAVAVDVKGRIWAVESGVLPKKLVGFDPKTEKFFSIIELPSGGTVRRMYFDKPTRAIWFGTDAGTLGRAKIP